MNSSAPKIMLPPPADSPLLNNPVPAPPIVHKLLVEHDPTAFDKDKSIHPEHGVIRYPFYFGGLASCASSICTLPLGVACLTASLTRALTYSTVRFALYEKMKESATTTTHTPSGFVLAGFGATAGFTGSIAGNFADIVAIRMQNDMSLPIEQRRNYRNILHGTRTMIRQEGWSSIWTGVWIGAGRAAIATATQLAGYDVFKRELMARTSMTDTVPTHITASCLAGFLSTLICIPLDVFKARLMTLKTQIHSHPVMLTRMMRAEGIRWMFKGITPALISRAPSTIVTFVTFEQLKRAYRRLHDLE